MHIISKRGNQDNVITYEHICDTQADMASIERQYITLGSVCIVLQGQGGAMEVYMADSSKEWHSIIVNAGADSSAAGGLSIHICSAAEVSNGKPNIEFPLATVLYLVPTSGDSDNLYDEYIYVNDAWERFGSGQVSSNALTYGSTVKSANLLVDDGIITTEMERPGAITLITNEDLDTIMNIKLTNSNQIPITHYKIEELEIGSSIIFSDLVNDTYTLTWDYYLTENDNTTFYIYDINGQELAREVTSFNIEINDTSVIYVLSLDEIGGK